MQSMFMYDSLTRQLLQCKIAYTPGLYKNINEIVVNASNNMRRNPIKVNMDASLNTISVLNNAKGIPIMMHGEHDCYVLTLIFGQLLTGLSFDDDKRKTTGGRNGYGAKVANIFSTEFVVECPDLG